MRYFFGFAAVILLILLTFILIWRGFTGGPGEPEGPPPLTDYTFTSTVMRLTVDGEINTQREHRAYRVIVSRSETRLEVLKGYDRKLAQSRSYPSIQEAYGHFLRALDLMGYTEGIDNPDLEDERGFCPFGKRYIYEIVDGTEVIQRYWSTSCGSDEGTFEGDASAVRRLFQNQIPDFRDLTRDIGL